MPHSIGIGELLLSKTRQNISVCVFFGSQRRMLSVALEHHAAGTDWPHCTRRCWVPESTRHSIQLGYRAVAEPPTASDTAGAVSISPLVVVSVRRAEIHTVWPPVRVIMVEGVTSVAIVPGHVQSVVVGLRFNAHTVVLGPQPLTRRCDLHFHAQTTT